MGAKFDQIAIGELQTPALLLDPARMDRNIARMRRKMNELGVAFRPHVKTAKSLEVVRRLAGDKPGPITVSTLREAEQLAQFGFTDILYAVGLTPNKIARVQALRRSGVDLKVIVDSLDAAIAIGQAPTAGDAPIPVLIEIDSDGHRAGVDAKDADALLSVARQLSGGLCLAGVMTHAGGSYSARSHEELRDFAVRERKAVVDSAAILREAGHRVDVVSVGSTPSVLFSDDMRGVTEARAGVFVFFDLVMAGIGVCSVDDIAVSVLSSVGSVQHDRGRYIIDAGWAAMSRDRGTASQPIDQGYGIVCDATGKPYRDLIMIEANQEHGVLALRPGSDAAVPELKIGDMVRILPNHACATAGQHDGYFVTDEQRDMIVDRWARFGGW